MNYEKKKSIIQRIKDAIRFWFSHSVVVWIKAESNEALIENPVRAVTRDEILKSVTKELEDNTWHHLVFIFRRFGRNEFYVNGRIKELL